MIDALRTEKVVDSEDLNRSAVSWPAVIAGGFAGAALSLVLLAFGGAMGFSSVSPWANSGLSTGAFKLATGIYLIIVAMLSSTIGGYIAGRLRTKWVGAHTEEVTFRDTAHGFLAWCTATLIGAAALGGAATYVLGGGPVGTAQEGGASAARSASVEYFTDMLMRSATGAQVEPARVTANEAARHEAMTILGRSLTQRADLPAADRSYLAQLVSARTGLPAADADRRVSDVVNQAKTATDQARKSAAALSLWLALSMLVGAFSASLAALEGGQLRDGRWKGVIGGKSYQSISSR